MVRLSARRKATITFGLFVSLFVGVGVLHADPCGMVPPVYTGPGTPIMRVGPQKTYVFYKNGIESLVLRPAFSGKVSNFGMLIPFPSVPAIRKVPDTIFSHVAAAIDPPEVKVWIRRYRMRYKRSRRSAPSKSVDLDDASRAGSVRVLRREAVGMYQVAVLQAGSPKALARWMKSHGYVYPKGMDHVVLAYIRAKWCFVAVKTRVAGKQGVSPRPGMRKAKPRFPRGGTFRGAVQAMGFRFRTRRLVVPMRLSAFNKGKLRNVVYLLTDGPRRIRHIPASFVRRQVAGTVLYRNVTDLLPLRVYGGKPSQIRKYRWRWIQRRRNPVPHNGLAKVLFASDLLAVRRKRLSLPHEEKKKVFLRIGERLLLRGKKLDRLHRMALADARQRTVSLALRDLRLMTMTVVDGDFPRQILARENLTFSDYYMRAAKNKRKLYDATRLGAGLHSGGILTRWRGPKYARKWIPKQANKARPPLRLRRLSRKKRITRLLRQFRNAKLAGIAATKLAKMGTPAIPYVWAEVVEQQPMVPRGWALVTLADMGETSVGKRLVKVYDNSKNPPLVRTWAAAARIRLVSSLSELRSLSSLTYRFPPAMRPFRLTFSRFINGKGVKVKDLLAMASQNYSLRRLVAPTVLSRGSKPLLRLLVRAKDNRVRRLAAAYLATMARKKPRAMARSVIRLYRFVPNAKRVPWDGGALFVPWVQWKKGEAQKLVGHLLAWMVWSNERAKSAYQKQIHNNIRSLSLARIAGYRSPGWRQASVTQWIEIWGKAMGCEAVTAILRKQNLMSSGEYAPVLSRLGCPL
jgi:hypothetical protein